MHCAQDLRKSQLPKHRPSRRGFGSCVFRRRLAHSAQRTRDARPYGCCVRRGPAANPVCGPGGHQGRPYGHGGNVNRVRRGGLYALLCPATGTTGGRNKSHPGQGGSMWASTPTRVGALLPSGRALPCHLPLGNKGRLCAAFAARVDMARKGALPVAEQATAAAQQPLALAGRYAGREGLAATRTIDPYGGRG